MHAILTPVRDAMPAAPLAARPDQRESWSNFSNPLSFADAASRVLDAHRHDGERRDVAIADLRGWAFGSTDHSTMQLVRIQFPGRAAGEPLALREHAFAQLCQKIQAPAPYISRLPAKLQMACVNVGAVPSPKGDARPAAPRRQRSARRPQRPLRRGRRRQAAGHGGRLPRPRGLPQRRARPGRGHRPPHRAAHHAPRRGRGHEGGRRHRARHRHRQLRARPALSAGRIAPRSPTASSAPMACGRGRASRRSGCATSGTRSGCTSWCATRCPSRSPRRGATSSCGGGAWTAWWTTRSTRWSRCARLRARERRRARRGPGARGGVGIGWVGAERAGWGGLHGIRRGERGHRRGARAWDGGAAGAGGGRASVPVPAGWVARTFRIAHQSSTVIRPRQQPRDTDPQSRGWTPRLRVVRMRRPQ